MFSTGGLRAIHKYDIVDNATDHRNHRRICTMCNNVATSRGIYIHHNDEITAKELSWL
jgi:hypothetical protein